MTEFVVKQPDHVGTVSGLNASNQQSNGSASKNFGLPTLYDQKPTKPGHRK